MISSGFRANAGNKVVLGTLVLELNDSVTGGNLALQEAPARAGVDGDARRWSVAPA